MNSRNKLLRSILASEDLLAKRNICASHKPATSTGATNHPVTSLPFSPAHALLLRDNHKFNGITPHTKQSATKVGCNRVAFKAGSSGHHRRAISSSPTRKCKKLVSPSIRMRAARLLEPPVSNTSNSAGLQQNRSSKQRKPVTATNAQTPRGQGEAVSPSSIRSAVVHQDVAPSQAKVLNASHATFTGAPVPCRILNDSTTLEELGEMPSTSAGNRVNSQRNSADDTLVMEDEEDDEDDVDHTMSEDFMKKGTVQSARRSSSDQRSQSQLPRENEQKAATSMSIRARNNNDISRENSNLQNDPNSTLNTEVLCGLQSVLREIRQRTQCIKESELDRLLTNGELLMNHLVGTVGTNSHNQKAAVITGKKPLSKDRHNFTKDAARRITSKPSVISSSELSSKGDNDVAQLTREMERSVMKMQSLQRALNSTKEELNAMKCQYQAMVLQLCNKDTEIIQMKHGHQQQMAELRTTNTSLNTEVNELLQENNQLKYAQQQLTQEVQRTSAVIQRVDEYFRKLLNGLEVSPPSSVEALHPHRLHQQVDKKAQQTKSSNRPTVSVKAPAVMENEIEDPSNHTSTQLLMRVVQLLETVVGGDDKKRLEPAEGGDKHSSLCGSDATTLTAQNLERHNSHFRRPLEIRLEDAMKRFTSVGLRKDASKAVQQRQKPPPAYPPSSSSDTADSLVSWLADEPPPPTSSILQPLLEIHRTHIDADIMPTFPSSLSPCEPPSIVQSPVPLTAVSKVFPECRNDNLELVNLARGGRAVSEFSMGVASSTTVSTMRSVDERDFANGLANLDSQISRLQQMLHSSS